MFTTEKRGVNDTDLICCAKLHKSKTVKDSASIFMHKYMHIGDSYWYTSCNSLVLTFFTYKLTGMM